MLSPLTDIVPLALGTAALSITLTESHLGKLVHWWMERQNFWLGLLFSCGYCVSHWIAILLVTLYRVRWISSGMPFADYTVSVFVVVGASALISGMIKKLKMEK